MKGLLLISQILAFVLSNAQSYHHYVVTFKDKIGSEFSIEHPSEFLSERSVTRRINQGIAIDETDLPLSPQYLNALLKIPNLQILAKSKWFNDVVVSVSDSNIALKLGKESFVKSIVSMPGSHSKTGLHLKKDLDTSAVPYISNSISEIYGNSERQVTMLNCHYLHSIGYRGDGMRIAIIDAGFTSAWTSPHFAHLYKNGRIIDTYDFIRRDKDVYGNSVHGTYVLSTIASNSMGVMVGTAPDAEFLLLRSEDSGNEYLLEEYFWTEAAEFADSAGADVVNTSLGYSHFDDSLENHSFEDMNGHSTRITKSTDKAFEKGMLMFNSAGNAGASDWQKITAPSDAFKVLAVGALDSASICADFSSRGPSGDGRIKPDLMAMGKGACIGFTDGNTGKSNGTSFSSPILAGAAACLWQANPGKKWTEVREALIKSADHFSSPDSNYGYGTPDMILADDILKGRSQRQKTGNPSVSAFPNPFNSELFIVFKVSDRQELQIDIYNSTGIHVGSFKRVVEGGNSSFINLSSEVNGLQSGIYLFKMSSRDIQTEIRLVHQR